MRRIATSSPTATIVTRNHTGRASRRSNIRTVARAAAIAWCLISATSAFAQDPAKPAPDSLAARLERAEEAIELLKQQLADQAQTGVQTRSRMTFELSGRVLLNAFSNSGRVNMLDVPLFVQPLVADGLPRGSVGLAARQSAIGFAVAAPNVLGADFSGDVSVDFFGGQYDASTVPLARLRTMRASLRWKGAELMLGQDVPLMSLLNPLSLAAVGAPGFSTSGNLWAWLPQVRFGVERQGNVRVGVQGAVLAPTATGSATGTSGEADVAQRSRRPFVEARAHVQWGADEMTADIGVGTHAGWYATPNSPSRRRSSGIGVDALIPLTPRIEVRGEWYVGDGMQGLGGGAIGQLFNAKDRPIHSTGMWGQLNVTPSPRLTVGGGFGFDDPDDADMSASARLKNAASEVHLHVRPAGPLVFGVEYRRMATTYASGKLANDHLNIAAGFVF